MNVENGVTPVDLDPVAGGRHADPAVAPFGQEECGLRERVLALGDRHGIESAPDAERAVRGEVDPGVRARDGSGLQLAVVHHWAKGDGDDVIPPQADEAQLEGARLAEQERPARSALEDRVLKRQAAALEIELSDLLVLAREDFVVHGRGLLELGGLRG